MKLMIFCQQLKYSKQVVARVEGYSDFVLCYKTELKSLVFGQHLYHSVWTSAVGENLFTAPDKGEEALSYDEFTIGVFKDENCSLLVGHLPIEISSLSYYFLKKSSENKIIAKITGKREREIGLQKQPLEVFYEKRCSFKFHNIHRKTPVPESLF